MLDKLDEVGSNKNTFFELLGGEQNGVESIRNLVETFYDIMDSDPKVILLNLADASRVTE